MLRALPKKFARYAVHIISILFLIFLTEPSKADDTGHFDDVVISVSATGEISFENNPPRYLWALQVLEPEKLNIFLKGRKITCIHVENGLVDCGVWTSEDYPLTPDVQMDLYTWLPELGWAMRFCDSKFYSPLVQINQKEVPPMGYTCLVEGKPRKGFIQY